MCHCGQLVEAVGWVALLSAQLVVTRVDHNAHEPTLETATLERVQRTERFEKAVLGRVGSGVLVLESSKGDAKGQILIGVDQSIEGFQIAAKRLGDRSLLLRIWWNHRFAHANLDSAKRVAILPISRPERILEFAFQRAEVAE